MNKDELFKNAIKENGEVIFRICSRFFGGGEDAKDASQEILLKIWLSIEKFRGDSSIKTWITRIAVNNCITYRSREKKRKNIIIPISPSLNRDIRGEKEFEDDENKLLFFREFMKRLDPSDKILISLYLEDLGTKEISEISGVSENNVRVKIHRIKNQIKREWSLKYGTR
ncbi:MAG: RNA polymerase sigma factor [Ignavibacteriaceae bacterium]